MGGKILLLVVAVALAVSGCSYQTAGAPKGDLTLTATFDDAQGLVAGHSVQMSDITIGTVTKVELVGYKARATLSIEDGIKIPKGTRAEIKVTSLLGENYVDLQLPPGASMDRGPFLASGSAITSTFWSSPGRPSFSRLCSRCASSVSSAQLPGNPVTA